MISMRLRRAEMGEEAPKNNMTRNLMRLEILQV